jgi:hypothetical protein
LTGFGRGAQSPVIQSPPPLRDLAAFLPAPGEAPGWTPASQPQRYIGEDLFVFINGGAEIYHEYGFRQVLARDYADGSGRTVALEIFEMAGPAAAYGMFTFKSSGKGRPAGIGQDSELEDYYVNFWKGSILVTVTGFDSSPASLAGVLAIAKAVEKKISGSGVRPDIFDGLPPDWAAAPARKYLKGPLGLYNLYPFFTADVFKFREGAAVEKNGLRLFLLRYSDAAERERRFPEIVKAFSSGSRYRKATSSPEAFSAEDGKKNIITGRGRGARLALIVGPPGPDDPALILDRILR